MCVAGEGRRRGEEEREGGDGRSCGGMWAEVAGGWGLSVFISFQKDTFYQ